MSLLKNRWLTIAASLVLGGVFLYSSWHKIADPPDFAHIVFNYKLVPANLINVVAIFMPWFEVMAGLAVLTGLGRRGGALGLGPPAFGSYNTTAHVLAISVTTRF